MFHLFNKQLENRRQDNIVIKELDDSKPILSEVKWNKEWGKTMQLPGIGVKFENIDGAQLKEICEKGQLL